MLRLTVLPFLILTFLQPLSPPNEVDELWAEVKQTVQEGDFESYAALYHKEAVLVDAISGSSYPISEALAGWKQGFEDTEAGKMTADVDFKFSRRIHNDSTAHDTGMFRYSSQIDGQEKQTVHIHFQALMIKSESKWKIMMEYQTAMGSKEDWDALK